MSHPRPASGEPRTSRKVPWLACLLLTVFTLAGPPGTSPSRHLVAQESTATEGALFLLLPIGARGIAVGRAMTALGGIESVFWNPAGLTEVQRSRVVIYRGDNIAGEGTSVSFVRSGNGRLVIGLSYHLNDVGEQDLTDEQGNLAGTLSTRNHLGIVTAATSLGSAVDLGINFKVARFQVSCRGTSCPDVGTTATSYMADVGVRARPLPSLGLAAMVAHVGTPKKIGDADPEPLPARFRIGATVDVTRLMSASHTLSGLVSVEMQDRLSDPGDTELYLGGELVVGREDALALRVGYVLGDQSRDGARVGLGVLYNRIDLSIAKSLATSSFRGGTQPVHVTFAIRL